MRKICTFGGYFETFMDTLTEDERRKINYGLLLLKTENRLPAKFVKHIENGLYELRTEFESKIFRTFFIFDRGNVIVLFNGFQKKSQKTPRKEIIRAKQIMKEYYETTRK
ncbi:MAG: type II toxin-antitoxin system RelE/ParE family toxin [Bacteroidales bacterium]|nr:type II toxin-antitoxin system RelE/ParE family toxin [Bacteroidales bacterium]